MPDDKCTPSGPLACDVCGWRHSGPDRPCPPRDEWRTPLQRAKEAEATIAEMAEELRRLRMGQPQPLADARLRDDIVQAAVEYAQRNYHEAGVDEAIVRAVNAWLQRPTAAHRTEHGSQHASSPSDSHAAGKCTSDGLPNYREKWERASIALLDVFRWACNAECPDGCEGHPDYHHGVRPHDDDCDFGQALARAEKLLDEPERHTANATDDGRVRELHRLSEEKAAEWKRAENAEAARDNYKQLWDDSCRAVAELCELAGMPEGGMPDVWTLKECIEDLLTKVKRMADGRTTK